MVRKWIKDNETINTHIPTAYLSSAVTKFGLDFFQKSQDTVLIWAKKGWEIIELGQLSRSALEYFQLNIPQYLSNKIVKAKRSQSFRSLTLMHAN